jgi:uncharacterized protein (DUF1015 family)
MPLIRPFAGLRPVPAYAAEVVAPPYDVLSAAEARERSVGRPWSFLHISRAEIDLPLSTDPHDPVVYHKAADNLRQMMDGGILVRDPNPCYYVYRLIMGTHVQTGLVAAASVRDYDLNRIRRHEFTRPEKEDDRARHIGALNAQTGPVLLAYRSREDIDAMLESATQSEPDVDLVADDRVGHTLWVVRDPGHIAAFTRGFESLPALYIADGHHRSAAASRVAAVRAATDTSGSDEAAYFLAVAFPHTQLQILSYNRVVKDLHGLTVETFLARLAAGFTVTPVTARVEPARSGEFGMYLGGQWYRLTIHADCIPQDPVARLDASILADRVLAPHLGVTDPRRDSRIDFVGGIRGAGELERRVDTGEMAVAFSLNPTRMEDLMAVADAGEVMPPKSTWFEPKLADGLISHLLD